MRRLKAPSGERKEGEKLREEKEEYIEGISIRFFDCKANIERVYVYRRGGIVLGREKRNLNHQVVDILFISDTIGRTTGVSLRKRKKRRKNFISLVFLFLGQETQLPEHGPSATVPL
jgi:hypothetical protein